MAGVEDHVLDAVRAAMRAKAPRAPTAYDKVYKEECCFSFDTPLSSGGLFVNLATWQAYGADYVRLDHERSGSRLYLHEKWTKVRCLYSAPCMAPASLPACCQEAAMLRMHNVCCMHLACDACRLDALLCKGTSGPTRPLPSMHA
jgi:hypothetical protein